MKFLDLIILCSLFMTLLSLWISGTNTWMISLPVLIAAIAIRFHEDLGDYFKRKRYED